MRKFLPLLMIAALTVLSACAPATTRVLGAGSSSTYLLNKGLFERQAALKAKDADSKLDVYRVEPPVLSLRETLVTKDVQGPTLGRIIRKVFVLTPTFEIYRQDQRAAHVSKAPLARNYFVEVAPGQDDVLALEMVIALNELTAAQQAKK